MHADPSISDEHPKEKDGFETVNPQVSDIGNPKHTSIELRRLPVDVFVQPLNDSSEDITSLEGLNAQQKNEDQRESRMIRRVFQNSNYTLNTQMMISFGLVNFLTILFVVIICVVVTFRTGEKVKSVQVEAFQSLTESSLSITARYLAESLDRRMMPLDVVDIIYEATQDRFLGGLQESDEYVPFPDAITGDNIYPVIGPDLFLDWQVPRMVNQSNHQEHLQSERWSFYQRKSAVSAASGLFVMQGTCDPGADQGGAFYWENCSDSSNDIALGGSYNPSNLTSIVYRKGKDLVPVLKAIFEAHSQIRDLGLFFKAEGNGASINYPAYALDTMTSYTSLGCDWMTRPNPLDPKRSIGTTNEISRCHPAGQNVSNRVYNPMERGWCQEQALNPAKTFARLDRNVWSPDHIQLFLGRAIYDRLTKDFLACIYVGVSFDGLVDFLEDNRVTPNSHVSIVQFDPLGHVISSSFHHSDRGSRDPVAINELDLGVTTESFRELLSLVDYTEEWNATDAKESYESFVVQEHGFAVYAYPVPPVPSEYDPNYRPEFLVLVSIADDDMLRAVRQVDDNVNETVSQLHVFACALGLIGFIVTSFIIFAMARTLTAPLRDMNSAALEIINSFGSAGTAEDTRNGSGRLVGSTGGLLWSPRTELHEVVAEYNKMVANFSGSLMAKTQRERRVEIKNPVISRDLLDDLYRSYKSNPNVWSNEDSNASPAASTLENYPCQNDHRIHAAAGPGFKNGGRNTTSGGFSSILVLQNKATPRISRSPLFWWTVMLIVLPLLLFTVSIAAWVMVRIQDEFNNNVDFAKDSYFEIVVEALQLHSNLRAQAVASSSSASVRDLFLFTRYFGWLLFDGLQRADSFTKLYSGADICKMYSSRSDCPYFVEHGYCHCSWNDPRTFETDCTDDTSEDPRYRQIPYFMVQSSDALPNGNRTKSSFPAVDFLPNTTAWWHDPLTVPGHEKASNAAGYESLYDRLRVSSAMPLFPVLYNYDAKKNSYLGSQIAFEADGLFFGFRGCPGFSYAHHFQSTAGNKAFLLRPELCPEGKFGFDPRCREWYNTGRNLAREQDTSVYITAPYTFASSGALTNAQSATSPLVDPKTRHHIAQILVDFKATATFSTLEGDRTSLSRTGFPLLITVKGDREENTVIGPDFNINEAAKKISEVVLPYDYRCLADNICQRNLFHFQSIEDKMKMGEKGVAKFERTSARGNQESVHIAYAPVMARSIRPVDPSDFSRGIMDGEYHVYSLGLCETESSLLEPFTAVAKEVDRQVTIAVAIISGAIALALVVIVYVSYIMTSLISEPMFYLLDLIRCINKMDINEDPPSVERIVGPREIISVSITLETLYKVVRAANDAFSSGELEKAYYVLADALRLFKKLGNEKAIGVASNNLGNLMTVLYRKMKDSPDQKEICGLTAQDIIEHGMSYFFDAIRLGEKAYDEFYNKEGWTSRCLDFMQHLANRYFNRALFLLSVVGDQKTSNEIEMLAVRDLEIARDMDLEIIAYRDDVGISREKQSEKLIHVGIVRAQGHNTLFDMGYPDDLMKAKGYPEHWTLQERFKEMFAILTSEKSHPGSILFEEVTYIGRLQELERELIRYLGCTGDVQSAARVAVRMLVEDEFVFADCVVTAIDAIRNYVDHADLIASQRIQLKRDLQECKQAVYGRVFEYLEAQSKSSTAHNEKKRDDLTVVSKSIKVRKSIPAHDLSLVLWICEEGCGGFVTMENF